MTTFLDRVTATGREHVRNHLHPFCSLCKEELDIYSKIVIFDLASDDEHPIGCKTHMIRSFRRSHEITPQEIPCEAQRSYCADINCHQCSPNCRSVSAHQKCVKWLQDISHAFEKQSVLDSDSYVIFFLRTQSPWTLCWSGPLLPPKLLYEPGHEAPSGEEPPQRQLRPCGPAEQDEHPPRPRSRAEQDEHSPRPRSPAEQDEHPPQPPYLPIEIMMQIFNLADETSRRWLYLRHSVLRPKPWMVEKRWDLRRVRSWKRGEDPKVVDSAVPSEDLWLKFDCSGLVELCTASEAGVHGWTDIYLFCKVDSTSRLQDSHAIFRSGMCYVKPPDDYGGQILLANSTIAYNKLLPPESESAIVANGVPLQKCFGITFFLLQTTDDIVGVHVHTKSISYPTRTHRWLEASKNCRLGSIFIPLAPLGASFMVVKWDMGGFSFHNEFGTRSVGRARKPIQPGDKGVACNVDANPTLIFYTNQASGVESIDLVSSNTFYYEHIGRSPCLGCASFLSVRDLSWFVRPLKGANLDYIHAAIITHEDGSRSAVGDFGLESLVEKRFGSMDEINEIRKELKTCKKCERDACASSLIRRCIKRA